MSTSANGPLAAVVLGGGLAGLAAARLLERHYPRVLVLERDRRPDASSLVGAVPAWAHAAPTRYSRSPESGICSTGRAYRLRGATPPRRTTGVVGGALGWMKIAVFPADNDTFSISVGAPVGEPRLKGLSDPARFERFV